MGNNSPQKSKDRSLSVVIGSKSEISTSFIQHVNQYPLS